MSPAGRPAPSCRSRTARRTRRPCDARISSWHVFHTVRTCSAPGSKLMLSDGQRPSVPLRFHTVCVHTLPLLSEGSANTLRRVLAYNFPLRIASRHASPSNKIGSFPRITSILCCLSLVSRRLRARFIPFGRNVLDRVSDLEVLVFARCGTVEYNRG